MGASIDVAAALWALRLFNEKADKLEGLSFTKTILSEPSGFRLKGSSEGAIKGRRYGPGEESIETFVLTFRFFVQNNEPSSFRKMAATYEGLGKAALLPDSLVAQFNEVRDTVNALLDSETPINTNGRALTHRDVFETFMWGDLAHANEEKKRQYDEWKSVMPYLFPLMQYEFVGILVRMLRAIVVARALNETAIAKLEAGGQG